MKTEKIENNLETILEKSETYYRLLPYKDANSLNSQVMLHQTSFLAALYVHFLQRCFFILVPALAIYSKNSWYSLCPFLYC